MSANVRKGCPRKRKHEINGGWKNYPRTSSHFSFKEIYKFLLLVEGRKWNFNKLINYNLLCYICFLRRWVNQLFRFYFFLLQFVHSFSLWTIFTQAHDNNHQEYDSDQDRYWDYVKQKVKIWLFTLTLRHWKNNKLNSYNSILSKIKIYKQLDYSVNMWLMQKQKTQRTVHKNWTYKFVS